MVTWPSATKEAPQMACVVDARLALSRHGLLSIARLSHTLAIWIPQELHRILRDTRPYLRKANRLTPRPYCEKLRDLDMRTETDIIGEELSQWDRLPEEDDLASLPLYYLGERADECLLPPHVDRRVRERAEQLQRGLHTLMARSTYDRPRGETVAACSADAAALCAALQPYGAFILTRLESDAAGSPSLCDYLDAWGVPAAEAPRAGRPASAYVRDTLARSGVLPVTWAGVPLAAVHVMLSGFPVLGSADKGLDDDAVARLWRRASVFWHQV